MSSKPIVGALIAASLCWTGGGARAAQATPEPSFYVGAGLGASSAYELRTEAFLQNLANLGLFFVFVDIVSVDTVDTGYRIFAGYRFTPIVGAELGYEDLGEWSRKGTLRLLPLLPGGPDRETSGSQREEARVVVLTSVLHLKKPRWLFFRVGGFYWQTDTVTSFDGTEPDLEESDSGGNVLLGIGGDIRLSRSVALRLQADHYLNVGPDDQNRTHYTLNALVRF